jgi:hypothetical protein
MIAKCTVMREGLGDIKGNCMPYLVMKGFWRIDKARKREDVELSSHGQKEYLDFKPVPYS